MRSGCTEQEDFLNQQNGSRRAAYDKSFFVNTGEGSLHSAQAVVPLVVDLLSPVSVLDVGCGTGAWLATFREHGVTDVFGIDGFSGHVDGLLIDEAHFQTVDLNAPFSLERQYDLVISLEVAEHLNASAAPGFVESLAAHGDVILFSAALPGQPGHHHVNLQWLEWWTARFERVGFTCFDPIRPQIWQWPHVAFWYRQNIVLFVRLTASKVLDRLTRAGYHAEPRALSVVHPELLGVYAAGRPPSPRQALRQMAQSIAVRLGLWQPSALNLPPYPPGEV